MLFLVGPNAHVDVGNWCAASAIRSERKYLSGSSLCYDAKLRDHHDGVCPQQAISCFHQVHALFKRGDRYLGCIRIETRRHVLASTDNQLRAVQYWNMRKNIRCARLTLARFCLGLADMGSGTCGKLHAKEITNLYPQHMFPIVEALKKAWIRDLFLWRESSESMNVIEALEKSDWVFDSVDSELQCINIRRINPDADFLLR